MLAMMPLMDIGRHMSHSFPGVLKIQTFSEGHGVKNWYSRGEKHTEFSEMLRTSL